MAKDTIVLRQLTPDFYSENEHLVELLHDKGRGYGVVLTEVKGYKFAIPMRSNMRLEHEYCFNALGDDNHKQGLDYSKAIIITQDRYVSQRAFKTRNKEEFVAIRKNAKTIVKEFESYVDSYIQAIKDNDQEFLEIQENKYSTLQNYHNELGIVAATEAV